MKNDEGKKEEADRCATGRAKELDPVSPKEAKTTFRNLPKESSWGYINVLERSQ